MRLPHLIPAICLCALLSIPAVAEETFTVVIDAGHGGKDAGAINGKNQEKNINLKVALRAGSLIENNCKDVKVIYTRKTDVFVELNKRADIANKANADLFISVHTNAAKSTSAYGAETYLLGIEENRTSANLSVAVEENKAIIYENDYQTQYEGYDPNSTESQIIFEFMQNEYLKESLQMAGLVQKEFTGYAKRRDRGVHQAGFLVLWRNAMPSILVELGYISNANEVKYLISDKGIEELSQCIYRAFSKYLDDTRKQKAQISAGKASSGNAATTKPSASAPASDRPVFKIQFLTSQTELKSGDSRIKGMPNVEFRKDGKLYKYTAGTTDNYDEAKKTLKKIQEKYKDAFITAFKGDVRMNLQDAIDESRKQ